MLATLASFLALALLIPAQSQAPANLAVVATDLPLNWFILFIHPLTDITSPAAVWALIFGATILLFALPFLPHPADQPIAVVDAANCNGCSRCHVDCPYEAITLAIHPHKPGHKIAIVDADNCAGCGICAGACPSSTPFRSQEKLVTGIDMPQQPVDAMRQEIEAAVAKLDGATKVVVFGCDKGADVRALVARDTAAISLICTGMLPPSFVEYALRGGAAGVLITGCRGNGCAYRLGNRWTEERLAGMREPHLRPRPPGKALRIAWADRGEEAALVAVLDDLRQELAAKRLHDAHLIANPAAPSTRMTVHG